MTMSNVRPFANNSCGRLRKAVVAAVWIMTQWLDHREEMNVAEIAEKFNLTHSQVGNIMGKIGWRKVSKYEAPARYRRCRADTYAPSGYALKHAFIKASRALNVSEHVLREYVTV